MKVSYKKPLPATPISLLRSAGYAPFRDPQSGEESFVRRLGSAFYPRFHMYVKETHLVVTFDLHLDQKKPSYEGAHKHAGEYEGSVVAQELLRIKDAFLS